jgi:IS1 family transposase
MGLSIFGIAVGSSVPSLFGRKICQAPLSFVRLGSPLLPVREHVPVKNLPISEERRGRVNVIVDWMLSYVDSIHLEAVFWHGPSLNGSQERSHQIIGRNKMFHWMNAYFGMPFDHFGGRFTQIDSNYSPQSRSYIGRYWLNVDRNPRALGINYSLSVQERSLSGIFGLNGLDSYENQRWGSHNYEPPFGGCIPWWRVPLSALCMLIAVLIIFKSDGDWWWSFGGGGLFIGLSALLCLTGKVNCKDAKRGYCNGGSFHYANTVPHKYPLTSSIYWGTVMGIGRTNMPNILPTEKQVAIIGALAEGSGIRQIERMTGVHRDTIMRLGVRVGKGCAALLDSKMRNLSCQQLQFDEIWGFIGKKERHMLPEDSPTLGDVWTFCAIDADTKLVPSFKVGKRDAATANAFVADVAGRVRNRVQISSDALRAYVEAVEGAFGSNVDFAQIVKTYVNDGSQNAERKYSASEFVIAEKKAITGFPNMSLASTSYVERLNGTTRLHMRRLTRLTYAFSKKLENFDAAVALHFAYYNFVKRHNTLRATPAMAAGIERDFWTVGDLVQAAA